MTMSGINVDPKAISIYPTHKPAGGSSVHTEVLAGKYIIWNCCGDVRASHQELKFVPKSGA